MRTALLFLACVVATPALASDLVLDLKSSLGGPAENAVVTVYPAAGLPPGPIHFGWPMAMTQSHIQFSPTVLIAPVGAQVSFPNRDAVRHHVYSFSPAKTFQLKLYGKDETRTVTFDKAGAVALGCNIHDGMLGFIKVVDTPYAAKSDASGQVTVRGLPGGPATVKIWRPFQMAKDNEVVESVTVPAQGTLRQSLVLKLREPPAMRMAR